MRKIDPRKDTSADSTTTDSGVYTVEVNGKPFQVEIGSNNDVRVNGQPVEVIAGASDQNVAAASNKPSGSGTEIKAHMPATVFKMTSRPGDTLTAAQPIMILEAMKMEIEVLPPADGTVREILVNEGQQVA